MKRKGAHNPIPPAVGACVVSPTSFVDKSAEVVDAGAPLSRQVGGLHF